MKKENAMQRSGRIFGSILAVIAIVLSIYGLLTMKKEKQEDVKQTQIEINQRGDEKKDVLFIFSKDDEELKQVFDQITTLPKQILQVETKDVGFINEEFKEFKTVGEKVEAIKGTPVLAVKDEKFDSIIEGIISKTPEISTKEQKEEFRNQINISFEKLNGYRILRIGDYSIGGKNSCNEGEWKNEDQCSDVVYIYDQRCNDSTCSEDQKMKIKHASGKKVFFKEVEITSEEGKKLKTEVLSKLKDGYNLPSVLVFKKDGENKKSRLIEIAYGNNESQKIDENTFYVLPGFLKNQWKEGNKICTLDETLSTNKPREYLSCSVNECKDKLECIQETKNTAEIFTMGFCPFCKDHVKKLESLSKELSDSSFKVRYLTYYDTSKNIDELKLDEFETLHGPDELQENVRQLCIEKEYGKEKLFTYFNTRFDSNFDENDVNKNLQKTLQTLNIDEQKLNDCKKNNEKELKERLIEDNNLSTKYGVRGTPTWLINGKYIEQMQPENIKTSFCKYNTDVKGC